MDSVVAVHVYNVTAVAFLMKQGGHVLPGIDPGGSVYYPLGGDSFCHFDSPVHSRAPGCAGGHLIPQVPGLSVRLEPSSGGGPLVDSSVAGGYSPLRYFGHLQTTDILLADT